MLEGNCSPSDHALVCLEPEIAAPPPRPTARPDAAFLTHLIAMAEQVPQLREKRRAAPEEAAAAYAATMARADVQ